MKTSKIIGTGSYKPKKILSNDELSKNLDTSDEWIKTRTGIKERRIANTNEGESCADMAVLAAKEALKMAKVDPSDIDLIIVATVTPDHRMPATACIVQSMLSAKMAPSFDIEAACAGSIFGLNVSHNFIKSGQCERVLFIASEVFSSIIDFEDRNTAVLFGDAASAAVLEKENVKSGKGFLDFKLYTDGSYYKTIHIPAGGCIWPIDQKAIFEKKDKMLMNGAETFKFAVNSLCSAIEDILVRNNLLKTDIAFIVPHQANLRIIEAISKKVDIPIQKFLTNLDKYANTSAASLLLAYDEALRAGKINSKSKILMLAIGAGFSWGVALYST